MVPLEDVTILYNVCNEPKKQVVVYKAPHIGSFFYNTEIYMKTIEEYFNSKNLIGV